MKPLRTLWISGTHSRNSQSTNKHDGMNILEDFLELCMNKIVVKTFYKKQLSLIVFC